MYRIAEALKQLRAQHNLTQAGLAGAVGLATRTIIGYEQGRGASSDAVQRIADHFHVSVDFLIGRDSRNVILLPQDLTAEQMRLINSMLAQIEKLVET